MHESNKIKSSYTKELPISTKFNLDYLLFKKKKKKSKKKDIGCRYFTCQNLTKLHQVLIVEHNNLNRTIFIKWDQRMHD